ncbi:MAG TPA: plastocyanin/azurin family copper-binding protein, partial [Solirubrobacterales bacterium]|nr:plastocyanin/azurin family copper-binding protein [Solirubrobacterales bacterium]
SAVLVSFAGLRFEQFPGRMTPLVILWFVALIGAATTFGVLNGKDEQEAKASELAKAGEEFTEEEASPVEVGKAEGGGEAKPEAAPGGPGGTLELSADPSQIAFDTTTLNSKPGKVTIEFENPATLEHDVAIEQDGKQIAVSETIGKGKTSVSADLAPGTYTFLCTVPGHAEAGMEGTLTVR